MYIYTLLYYIYMYIYIFIYLDESDELCTKKKEFYNQVSVL